MPEMTYQYRGAPQTVRVGVTASFGAPKESGISFRVLVDLVFLLDILLLLGCGGLALLTLAPAAEHLFAGEIIIATVSAAAVSIFMLRKAAAYQLSGLVTPSKLLAAGAGSLVSGGAVAMTCLLLLRHGDETAIEWAGAWVCGAAMLLAGFRATLGMFVRRWLRGGRLDRKVAVIGAGPLAEGFIRHARGHAASRTCVVGLYDEFIGAPAMEPETSSLAGYPIRGDLDTLLLDCRLRNVDAVVIALPAAALDRIRAICARLRPVVADIYVAPEICALDLGAMETDESGGMPLFPIARKPISNWRRVQKEVFDRVAAFLMIVLVAPLLVVVAVLIRLESPGPILFRQMRVGFKNNPFQILKFRTMHHHLNDRVASQQTSRSDRRVTRVGRVLRKLSIDELPQLFNVLCGDMSLVGPRPHAPGTSLGTSLGTRRVDDVLEDYAQRHRVKPGITGLAQVCGCRGEMVTEEQVMRRVRFDIEYIERWSLWLDIKILLLTVRRELYSRNAF